MQNLLDDPNDVGMMSLGLRLLSTPGKFGQALGTAGLGAMGDMQQQKQVQAMARQRAMQEQMQMMQLDQIKRQQAEQERLRQRQMGVENAYRGAMETPAQQALAQGGGPTVGNAQAMQGMAPRINQQKLIASLMAEDPIMAAQMMQPKPDELMTVAPGSTVLNKRDPTKPLFTAPEKATRNEDVELLKMIHGDGTPKFIAALEKLGDKKTSHAPATSLSVNTGDRIPHQLIKQQDELLDKVNVSRATDADLGALQSQIKAGQLKFGPVRNLINTGRNVAGMSNEESRSFGTFKSTLEKLRNDSLRLNAGVQTEGDAQRAWGELFQNINDTAFVDQRMTEIRKINQRAAQLHQGRLGVLRANSGATPLPMPDITPAIEPAAGGGIDSLVNKYRSK